MPLDPSHPDPNFLLDANGHFIYLFSGAVDSCSMLDLQSLVGACGILSWGFQDLFVLALGL